MSAWTTAQLDCIRELGHLGAEAVRDEIERRFGVRRSVHAVETMASRIHAPLKVRQVCPDCGVVGLRLNRRTGLCPRCTERLRLDEAAAFNELLMEERMEAADPSFWRGWPERNCQTGTDRSPGRTVQKTQIGSAKAATPPKRGGSCTGEAQSMAKLLHLFVIRGMIKRNGWEEFPAGNRHDFENRVLLCG